MSVDTIGVIIFVVLWVLVSVAAIAGVVSVINNYGKNRAISSFKSLLREAIVNSQPTWNQVRLMASTRPLTTGDISTIIRELLAEALGGYSAKLKPHIPVIESYIDEDKQDEPFEDMPQEIRIHLERIRDQLSNRPELLEALVNHLRDVRTENVRRTKRQALVSIVSLIVGLAGLIVGVLSIITAR